MKGYLYAIIAGASWGTIGFFVKQLNKLGLVGHEIAFIRMLFASIVGLFFILIKKRDKMFNLEFSTIKNIFFIGLLTQAGMNILLFISVIRVGMVTSTLLVCTGPIFTLLLSAYFFKEPLTLEKKLALALTITGGIVVVTEGNFTNFKFDLIGIACGLGAAFLYGTYPIFGKKNQGKVDSLVGSVYSFMIGLMFMLPLVDISQLDNKLMSVKGISLGIGFGLFATISAYIFYLSSLKYISVSKASLLAMSEIPTSTLIATLFLGEAFNNYKLIGIVLVVAGILVTNMNFTKENSPEIRIGEDEKKKKLK